MNMQIKFYSRRLVFSQLMKIVSGQDLGRATDDDHQRRVVYRRYLGTVPTGNARSRSPTDSTSGRGIWQGPKLLGAALLPETAFESTSTLSSTRAVVFFQFRCITILGAIVEEM